MTEKDSQQKLHLFVRMNSTIKKGNEQKGSLSSAYFLGSSISFIIILLRKKCEVVLRLQYMKNVFHEITLKVLKDNQVHVGVSMTQNGGKLLHHTVSIKRAKPNKACNTSKTTKQWMSARR